MKCVLICQNVRCIHTLFSSPACVRTEQTHTFIHRHAHKFVHMLGAVDDDNGFHSACSKGQQAAETETEAGRADGAGVGRDRGLEGTAAARDAHSGRHARECGLVGQRALWGNSGWSRMSVQANGSFEAFLVEHAGPCQAHLQGLAKLRLQSLAMSPWQGFAK